MNTISLNDLIAAVASTYDFLTPAVQNAVYLFIGTVLAMLVMAFVAGFFKKGGMKSGYYTGTKKGLVYDTDQELGKMKNDIQTKGMWLK